MVYIIGKLHRLKYRLRNALKVCEKSTCIKKPQVFESSTSTLAF